MDGGDLKTLNGGDLKTLSRQHGGIFGLLGKLFGLGLSDKQHGGIIGLLGKLFGLGPGELQKQMSDPIKQQMIMQRGGFPWALAGLSLLPALLGKGEEGQDSKSDANDQRSDHAKRRIGNTTGTHLQRSTASQTDRYSNGNGCSGFSG